MDRKISRLIFKGSCSILCKAFKSCFYRTIIFLNFYFNFLVAKGTRKAACLKYFIIILILHSILLFYSPPTLFPSGL